MLFDVRCGQEGISKQPWYILPALTHAFGRGPEIRWACCNHVVDCLVTLHFIGSGL